MKCIIWKMKYNSMFVLFTDWLCQNVTWWTNARMCQIMNGVACLTFSFSSTLILAVSFKVLMFTEK